MLIEKKKDERFGWTSQIGGRSNRQFYSLHQSVISSREIYCQSARRELLSKLLNEMYFRPRSNWKEECKYEIFKEQTVKNRIQVWKSSFPWWMSQHQEVNEWSFYYHFVSLVKYFSPLSRLIVPGLLTYQQSGAAALSGLWLVNSHQCWFLIDGHSLGFSPFLRWPVWDFMINLTTIIIVTHNKFAGGQTEKKKINK